MSNTSRHRTSIAAGVLVAGAAIPLAIAGAGWADQTSAASGPPAVVVAGPSAYLADSGGGTADVKDQPYVYDNRQAPETEET